jgi:hypothetical protein
MGGSVAAEVAKQRGVVDIGQLRLADAKLEREPGCQQTAADGLFRRMTHAEVSNQGETAEEFGEPEPRCGGVAHALRGTNLI